MDKKNISHKSLLAAAIMFMVMITILLSATNGFAWISNYHQITVNKIKPGRLDPNLEIYVWDKTEIEWVQVNSNGTVSAFLGEMMDISQLPQDCETYLKIKVNESSSAAYNYIAYIDNIEIEVTPKYTVPSGVPPIEGIDYYNADPSQKCFEYQYAVGTDNLDVSEISFGSKTQITKKGHPLTGEEGNPVGSDKWLYVKITPLLPELQNIFQCISMVYMPYTIKFTLTIQGESRTVNNEN